MSTARRQIRTVLDRLQAEGVINPRMVKRLQHIALGADHQLSKNDISKYVLEFMMLLAALMQPDRPDSRAATRRNYAIAIRHEANKATTGSRAAIKRTAFETGIPRRTVAHAVKMSRVPEFVSPLVANMMRNPEAWRNATAQNKTEAIKRKRMMREKPQSIPPELGQGLAKIRKSLSVRRATRQ